MNFPAKIFIIYAREDVAYKDALIKALSPLKNQGWVDSWHDGHIQPGQVWDDQIRQNLNAADLIVALISNDFFASEYIQQVEIHRAFERFNDADCVIVPVIVRACEWEPDERMARLQVLPTDGKPVDSWQKPDEAYKSVVAGIRRLIHDQGEKKPPVISRIKPELFGLTKKGLFRLLLIISVLMAADLIYRVSPLATTMTATAEENAFKSLRNIPGAHTFLENHPNSIHATEARQLIQHWQNDFSFHLQSARALYQADEIDKAFEEFEQARNIDPEAPGIKELLDKLNHKKSLQ
ncbi:MAG: toll/interleukin-1 receptor domain-containing protein [Saprospiraceae bacterium]